MTIPQNKILSTVSNQLSMCVSVFLCACMYVGVCGCVCVYVFVCVLVSNKPTLSHWAPVIRCRNAALASTLPHPVPRPEPPSVHRVGVPTPLSGSVRPRDTWWLFVCCNYYSTTLRWDLKPLYCGYMTSYVDRNMLDEFNKWYPDIHVIVSSLPLVKSQCR